MAWLPRRLDHRPQSITSLFDPDAAGFVAFGPAGVAHAVAAGRADDECSGGGDSGQRDPDSAKCAVQLLTSLPNMMLGR